MDRGRGLGTICAGLAALVVLMLLPGLAGAAAWTPLASNTTEDITAVEYQSADRFWFTTSNGKIFRRVGGAFQQEFAEAGRFFRDIEFQQGGSVGLAVGDNGAAFRSTDGGDTWVGPLAMSGADSTSENDCTTNEPLGNADSVHFAGNAVAWITAAGSQIFKSSGDASTVGQIWTAANGAGTCRIPQDVDDLFPAGASGTVYFVAKSFGTVYLTNDGLATPAATRPAEAGNGFDGTRRLAGDPANPSRQWSVFPGFGGGASYVRWTGDGWGGNFPFALAEAGTLPTMHDVGYAGGTVVAAGSQGTLLHSTDGANFFFEPAPGSLAATEWISVDVASAAGAAAGGRGGALVLSDNANVIGGVAAADTAPPETTITKEPKKKVKTKKKKAKVRFKFTSSEPGSSFVCSVDGKSRACTSPFKAKVKTGKRKFAVVSTDPSGNADPTPARYAFKVKRKK